jgi:dTDP-4-amino-4,6-dideoxygalactose transaminase
LSGNGFYTNLCHQFIEQTIGGKALVTSSCSTALDMAAILSGVGPGDEVIMPSFTFTSTANAFVLRGAKVVFADCDEVFPNVSAQEIERLITPSTKVIVVMHYAGVACDMDPIMQLVQTHGLILVEDAAMAWGAKYKGKPLGSFGHFACFSFHETKVLGCGEGGCLVVNDEERHADAEFVWEKGTNRAAFSRGETLQYEWVAAGSSFLPSEIQAAWLSAQLENQKSLLDERKRQWESYQKGFTKMQLPNMGLPEIPDFAGHNGAVYFLKCETRQFRDNMITQLAEKGIMAVFHYLPLHVSPFYLANQGRHSLRNAEDWAAKLVRLPLYHSLQVSEQQYIIQQIIVL